MKRIFHSVVTIRLLAIAGVLIMTGLPFLSCNTQQDVARKAILSMMQSMKEAAEKRDIEKILALCQRSPEFFVYSDGEAFGYDGFANAERQAFHTLKRIQFVWDTLHVRMMGSDVVAALAPFHEVLTDSNGVDTRLKGEVTWVASRIGGNWKFTFAHAWHQPDTTSR